VRALQQLVRPLPFPLFPFPANPLRSTDSPHPLLDSTHQSQRFHFSCVSLTDDLAAKIEAYSCDMCEQMGMGSTKCAFLSLLSFLSPFPSSLRWEALAATQGGEATWGAVGVLSLRARALWRCLLLLCFVGRNATTKECERLRYDEVLFLSRPSLPRPFDDSPPDQHRSRLPSPSKESSCRSSSPTSTTLPCNTTLSRPSPAP
jgi:hypothetical protein